jgi:hypothetical protein
VHKVIEEKMKKAHTTSGMTTSFPYVSFAMVMVVISALALAKRSALDAAILLNIFWKFLIESPQNIRTFR